MEREIDGGYKKVTEIKIRRGGGGEGERGRYVDGKGDRRGIQEGGRDKDTERGGGEGAAASISPSSFCSVCESLLENIATVSRFPCSFLSLQILASPRPPFKQILCG
jgi:hypothetical protein